MLAHTEERPALPPEVKNAMPPGDHVFQETRTIFERVQDIIGTNLLTKIHDDWIINRASRVLTRKNASPPLRPYIIGTNLVTKFHDDRTINVASIEKNALPPRGHVFFKQPKPFSNSSKISLRTNFLTKFHENWKINVAFRP
ncbi:hypothetical protein DPMN_105553 [Dreissena polymorpha]|uniref:Uncharacterized protein n=1 Tax=Dreissena polymorpha TaxID=45954 RepID=A0A9D4K3E6_DREPO|nr:hypothetical protein DPMN_105553 [Dreissena polymorpha]